MDQVEFARIIVGLAANAGIKMPTGLIDLWYSAFAEDCISIEQIRFAAGKILRKSKNRYGKMPTYDEFIEIIQGGSEKDKALVIANEIIVHLRSHGSRIFPKIDDPIAKHLMTKRWPYYEWSASVIESELKWWTKEFCEAYTSYSGLEKIDAPPLLGFAKEDVKKLVNNITEEF